MTEAPNAPDEAWLLDVIRAFALQVGTGYDDDTDELMWRVDQDGSLHVSVNCNDVFDWGSADGEEVRPEDIPDLVRARADATEACRQYPKPSPNHSPTLPDGSPDQRWLDFLRWSDLWVARKRGERPQGAYFTRALHSDAMRALFEAAGPAREGGVLTDPVRWPRPADATPDQP